MENFVKFVHAVFEICKRTDRQTDKQTHMHSDTLLAILRSYKPSMLTVSVSRTVSEIYGEM